MAEKKYVIAVCEDNSSEIYIPYALHIERNDSLWPELQIDDYEAARIAESDGILLIYGLNNVMDGVYIDTPENRDIIRQSLEMHQEYKLVKLYGRIPDMSEEPVAENDWEIGDDD